MKANTLVIVTVFGGLALTLGAARPLASPESSEPSIASVVDGAVSSIEKRVVGVAEAMPEEKYVFVPTNGEFKGVMSFGDQIKHIADDNYGGYSFVLREKAPASSHDTHITSKADILTYLRGSFATAHRAATSLTAENVVTPVPLQDGRSYTRLAMAIEVIGHAENHYGQIVEYLRMNGIIPPASRPATQ
jgi:hypothetical protein